MENNLVWPLPDFHIEIPQNPEHPGSFGARRKFDVHTGIDLYVPEGTTVVSMEEGRVVAIDRTFTGGEDTPKNKKGEPIWFLTEALLIEGKSGVLLYGELLVNEGLEVGSYVHAGDSVGSVKQVLKPKEHGETYKNPANSPSMLHLELYESGTTTAVYWQLDEPKPSPLLDPTSLLQTAQRQGNVLIT